MGIIYFVVLLGVIITVHEFGHFVAAKTFNVYVPEFSIGMGPKLFQKVKGETKYSLRLLPIGGYVAMAGEEGIEGYENVPYERTIKGIHPLKQLVVMLAGVFMNMVLALLIFFIVYANVGQVANPEPVFNEILSGSVAEQAGIEVGDRLVKATFVDGTSIKVNSYIDYMNAASFYGEDDPITFSIVRDTVEYEVTLVKDYIDGQEGKMFGFVFKTTYKDISLLECIPYAFKELKDTISTLVLSLSKLIRGRGLENLSGPVGIYEVANEQASLGLLNYLYLIGILSVNVGIMNLLPLPMLDGGQSIITIGEMIVGKKLDARIRTALILGSMGLLLLLMVFVTYQDIIRLFAK